MGQRLERQRPDDTWYPAQWVVVEHTKSSASDRYVYLTKEARKIIKKIQDSDEETVFLMMGSYSYMEERESALGRLIQESESTVIISTSNAKSRHKVRKSYISSLLDGGLKYQRGAQTDRA